MHRSLPSHQNKTRTNRSDRDKSNGSPPVHVRLNNMHAGIVDGAQYIDGTRIARPLENEMRLILKALCAAALVMPLLATAADAASGEFGGGLRRPGGGGGGGGSPPPSGGPQSVGPQGAGPG